MQEKLSSRSMAVRRNKTAKSKSTHQRSIWDAEIARPLIDSLPKLNPLNMMKNPVMFVVEVGSVITTALSLQHIGKHEAIIFNLQITLWLWFTVLFANFAEAMAEGRGKAQADALRRAKSETMANRSMTRVSLSRCRVPSFAPATLSLCLLGK